MVKAAISPLNGKYVLQGLAMNLPGLVRQAISPLNFE